MVRQTGARSGPAGRLTEPQSLTVASMVSRRAEPYVFTLGIWHW